MGLAIWITDHWFDLIQTVGIIGGLLFTAITIRKDGRARRISNSIAINQQHSQIWKELYSYPELSRVMLRELNLKLEPASPREELFVNALILHLSTTYRAMERDEFVKLDGLKKDVKAFFSLPLPSDVWRKVRTFHDKSFVDFIETVLK